MCRAKQLLVAILVLVLQCPADAAEPSVELFDGHSLDGWVTESGEPVTKGWVVEDGMLVCRRGGSIFTKKEYSDFELVFAWKIAQRGNSGVKYRVAFYEKGVWGRPGILGCEYQLFDDLALHPSPDTSTGSIYQLYAPKSDYPIKAAGEFNESKIVIQGDHIRHWLNGMQVVEAHIGSDEWKERIKKSKFGRIANYFENPAGPIELQDHGSEVWFRRLTLHELENKKQISE